MSQALPPPTSAPAPAAATAGGLGGSPAAATVHRPPEALRMLQPGQSLALEVLQGGRGGATVSIPGSDTSFTLRTPLPLNDGARITVQVTGQQPSATALRILDVDGRPPQEAVQRPSVPPSAPATGAADTVRLEQRPGLPAVVLRPAPAVVPAPQPATPVPSPATGPAPTAAPATSSPLPAAGQPPAAAPPAQGQAPAAGTPPPAGAPAPAASGTAAPGQAAATATAQAVAAGAKMMVINGVTLEPGAALQVRLVSVTAPAGQTATPLAGGAGGAPAAAQPAGVLLPAGAAVAQAAPQLTGTGVRPALSPAAAAATQGAGGPQAAPGAPAGTPASAAARAPQAPPAAAAAAGGSPAATGTPAAAPKAAAASATATAQTAAAAGKAAQAGATAGGPATTVTAASAPSASAAVGGKVAAPAAASAPASGGATPPGSAAPAAALQAYGGGAASARTAVAAAPAWTPATAAAQPNPAHTLSGTVLANGGPGQTLVRTEAGVIAVSGRLGAPAGAMVTLEILRPPASGGTPLPPALAGGLPTGAGALSPSAWPSLTDAFQMLSRSDAEAAQRLASALPAANGRLLTNVAGYLAAVRAGGDPRVWPGGQAARALDALGERGRATLRQVARDVAEAATTRRDATGAEWRVTTLPFHDGAEVQKVHMVVRRERSGDDDGDSEEEGRRRKGGGGQRFLLVLDLSRLGAMQIDGLFRGPERRFDLIIRTHQPLPPVMRQDMTGLFANTVSALGLHGTLGFSVTPQFEAPVPEAAAPPRRTGLYA